MRQSLLWELEKQGYNASYLFGTMHVKSKVVFSRLEQVKILISNSEVFAAEYDLDELQRGSNLSDLEIYDGGSLSNILGSHKFEKVRKSILKAFNIDILPYEHFMPLIIVNMIGEAILSKDFNQPLDVYLWQYAKGQEKSLVGIETVKSQKIILQKITMQDQVKMLKDLSRHTSKYRKGIFKMAKCYENEDIQKLYSHGKSTLGKYKNILLKKRNYIMQRRFEELAIENKTFFAVGAGHLAGDYGILKLLKNNGWKARAISI